jgi:DNA-binding HxlR family transcriptional regulator
LILQSSAPKRELSAMVSPRKLVPLRKLFFNSLGLPHMTRIDNTSEVLTDVGVVHIKVTAAACREENDHSEASCRDHQQRILALQDAMAVLSGKWKILVIGSLSFKGKQRFTELLKSVGGIRAKMLSKELQELEANQLITRTVKQTKPLTVEYEMTPYGRTLENLITEIMGWGMAHRAHIMRGDS